MQLKVVTWNIGGAKFLQPGEDPALLKSYTVDGLPRIIDYLRSFNADIITLQEVQKKDEYDQAKIIADALGFNYVHNSTSDSHINEDHQLGHAILSKFSILEHSFNLFSYPKLTTVWEDGTTKISHDKGFTTCTLDMNGQDLTVTTLHLTPFRRFHIDMGSDTAKNIISNVEKLIATTKTPWIVTGDFNIDSEKLESYFPNLFSDGLEEIELTQPTTPKGRKYDHILYRACALDSWGVHTEAPTDHYPVIATFEVSS